MNNIGLIAIKFGRVIHVPVRMNSNPFGDLQFFFQSPAQNLNLCNTCKTNDVPISLSCTLRPVLISTFYASFQLYRNKDCVVSRQFSPSELVRLSGCSDSAGPDVPGSVQWEPFPVGVPGHFLWD